MKLMEKMLETGTSPIDDAHAPAPGSAPAPVSAPTHASAPVSTDANKIFASIAKTTQQIIVKLSDNDVVIASKDIVMNKANKA